MDGKTASPRWPTAFRSVTSALSHAFGWLRHNPFARVTAQGFRKGLRRTLRGALFLLPLSVPIGIGYVVITNYRGEAALQKILAQVRSQGLPDAGTRPPVNGARYYRAAFELANGADAWGDLPYVGSGKVPPLGGPVAPAMRERLAAFVGAHREFFALIEAARLQTSCDYGLRPLTIGHESVHLVGGVAGAVRNLCVQSLYDQARGRGEAALDGCRAIADIGMSFNRDQWTALTMVRAGDGGLLVACLEQALSRLQPDTESLALTRVKLLTEADGIRWREVAKNELGYLAFAAAHLQWAQAFGESSVEESILCGSSDPDRRRSAVDRIWFSVCPGAYQLAYADYLKATLEEYNEPDRPSWERAKRLAPSSEGWPSSEGGRTAIVMIAHEASMKVAAAGILAELFRIRNGRWPVSAVDLGADWPLDPFDGQPLRYVKTPTGCLVYSIGRNLKDEAAAVDAYGQSRDIVFHLLDPERRSVSPEKK